MKTFKILVVICLLLFLLASFAVFVFTSTFDTKRFKKQLITQLTTRLGRKVEMTKLELSISLFRGAFLNVKGFRIKDDEGFSKDPLLSIDDIKLDISILAFLMQKKVVVSSITVDSPKLNLVKSEEGVLNTQAFKPFGDFPAKKGDGNSGSQQDSKIASSSPKSLPTLPELLVRSIRVEQGSIMFTDKTLSPSEPESLSKPKPKAKAKFKAKVEALPPPETIVKNIALDIAGFSSSSPFKFTGDAAVFSEERNLKIKGQGQLDLKTLQVRMNDVSTDIDIFAVELSELEKSIPDLNFSELGLTVKAKVETLFSHMVVGQEGIGLFSGAGNLTLDSLNIDKFLFFTKGVIHYEVSEKDIQIRNVALTMNNGALNGEARLDDYHKQQKYSGEFDVKDVALTKVIPEFGPQVNFRGTLNSHMKLNGQGFVPDKIMSLLNGEGQVSVSSGVLENFNVLRFMLSQMTMLPKLDEVLIDSLSEIPRLELQKRSTLLEDIQVSAILQKGSLIVNKADFVSSLFSVSAQGKLDRERNMTFSAVMFIAPVLTAEMTMVAPELKVLVEKDGRMSIPVKAYSGPLSGFRIFPDIEALGKKMNLEKGKDQLTNWLDRIDPPPESAPAVPAQPVEQPMNIILDPVLKDK